MEKNRICMHDKNNKHNEGRMKPRASMKRGFLVCTLQTTRHFAANSYFLASFSHISWREKERKKEREKERRKEREKERKRERKKERKKERWSSFDPRSRLQLSWPSFLAARSEQHIVTEREKERKN